MRFNPLVAVIMLTACHPAPPAVMTDAERQAIAQEIHQRTLGWMTADSLGDMNASIAYFVQDSSAHWVGDSALFLSRLTLYPSKAAVREWFESFFVDGRAMSWSLGGESVFVLSPDHAVQVFEGTYSVRDSNGNAGPDVATTVTTVWVREAAEWRILHCHQS